MDLVLSHQSRSERPRGIVPSSFGLARLWAGTWVVLPPTRATSLGLTFVMGARQTRDDFLALTQGVG